MLMILNMAALLVLSLFPDTHPHTDPHGLNRLVDDGSIRELVLSGNFHEYNGALDKALYRQMATELSAEQGGRMISDAQVRQAVLAKGGDLKTLFDGIKSAISVATFASTLHAAGPVKALHL